MGYTDPSGFVTQSGYWHWHRFGSPGSYYASNNSLTTKTDHKVLVEDVYKGQPVVGATSVASASGAFVTLRYTVTVAAVDAVTPDPSDAAASAKVVGYAGAIIVTAIGGAIHWGIDKLFNQSAEADSDPLDDILDDATPGEETKGRTTNWDKPGGWNQANEDFDDLVPGEAKEITDSKGGKGRFGTTSDGRKVNVRPNSSDGRPTLEVQEGKKKIKIRYDD